MKVSGSYRSAGTFCSFWKGFMRGVTDVVQIRIEKF